MTDQDPVEKVISSMTEGIREGLRDMVGAIDRACAATCARWGFALASGWRWSTLAGAVRLKKHLKTRLMD